MIGNAADYSVVISPEIHAWVYVCFHFRTCYM